MRAIWNMEIQTDDASYIIIETQGNYASYSNFEAHTSYTNHIYYVTQSIGASRCVFEIQKP